MPPGLKQGRLRPLGIRPNQVSSLHQGDWRAMDALPFDGDVEAAKARLKRVAAQFERTALVREDGNYLHFTFSTRYFTDDVEFHIVPDDGVVHFRSASRWGWGDRGVNKKRMRRFTRLWNEES